jgi:pyruvate dehydrogenase E1 component alpha subunit
VTTPTMVQVLPEAGDGDVSLAPEFDEARLIEIMRWMKLGRALDQRCISLQRQGKSGTYGPMAGQEAALVGSALALDRARDWVVPQYREGLAMAMHGFPLAQFLLYLRGHPRGGQVPADVNLLPVQISVASQILHAVGLAWGFKLQKLDSVVLTYFGDGATSEGAFHEAANFAGVFRTPVVLFCQNNGWAISTPRSRQTAAASIAEKAVAYGFPGVQVDGNDVFAVYAVVKEAVARARSGEGPTLVEAVTYRLAAHTTADDPSRYVPPEELESRRARDPILRYTAFLERRGLWDEERALALDEEVRRIIADASTEADAEPDPPADGFFDHVFTQPTWRQQEQRAAFVSDQLSAVSCQHLGAGGQS